MQEFWILHRHREGKKEDFVNRLTEKKQVFLWERGFGGYGGV